MNEVEVEEVSLGGNRVISMIIEKYYVVFGLNWGVYFLKFVDNFF